MIGALTTLLELDLEEDAEEKKFNGRDSYKHLVCKQLDRTPFKQ